MAQKQQVKVFLSSTFIDMQEERDYLIKKIFPAIKRECSLRGVDFVALDLRWGIDEQTARLGKVIEICMDEIVRSRPFFIGLLGGRYGWIPKDGDRAITQKLLLKYPWIRGAMEQGQSITEMEMQFGVLSNEERINAFFFQREENSVPAKFREKKGSLEEKRLAALKEKINTAAQNGICSSSTYDTVKSLGKQVYDAVMARIEELYPAKIQTKYQENLMFQADYLQSRRDVYVRHEVRWLWYSGKEFPAGWRTVGEDSIHTADFDGEEVPDTYEDFLRIEATTIHNYIVYGEKGVGKTAFLANWAHSCLWEDSIKVHTVINDRVNTVEQCKRMFLAELSGYLHGFDFAMLDTPLENQIDLQEVFNSCGFEEPVCWIIDGVEKLCNPEERSCIWVNNFPSQIVETVLVTSDISCIDTGIVQNFRKQEICPCTPEEIREITVSFLREYSKALSDAHLERISNAKLFVNPHILKVFLQELLQFGEHERLDWFIDYYLHVNDKSQFYFKILKRVEDDFGKNKVERLLKSVYMCVDGLPVEALIKDLEIDDLDWVAIYTAIAPFVVVQNGYLKIEDLELRELVANWYLISDKEYDPTYVKRLGKILKRENSKILKEVKKRVWREDKFIYAMAMVAALFSDLLRNAVLACSPAEERRMNLNRHSLLLLYARGGMKRAFRKECTLSFFINNSAESLPIIQDPVVMDCLRISNFLRWKECLAFRFCGPETEQFYNILPVWLNYFMEGIHKEVEREGVLLKLNFMPLSPDLKKSLISKLEGDAKNEKEAADSLEEIMEKLVVSGKGLDVFTASALTQQLPNVFIWVSDARVRGVLEKALQLRDVYTDEFDVALMNLVAAAAAARLKDPAAEEYVSKSHYSALNRSMPSPIFLNIDLFMSGYNRIVREALNTMTLNFIRQYPNNVMLLRNYYRIKFVEVGYQVLREPISQLGKTSAELAVYADEFKQKIKDYGLNDSYIFEKEAFILYNLKLYNVAYKLFEAAVSSTDNSDKGRKATLYDWMSFAAHWNSDYDLAVTSSRNAVEMIKAGNDTEEICNMYCNLGESISFWLKQKNIDRYEEDIEQYDVDEIDWGKELEPLYLEGEEAFSMCCRLHKCISAQDAHKYLVKWADFLCMSLYIASSLIQPGHIEDCIECMEAFKNGKGGSVCDSNFDERLKTLYEMAGK